ncbi:MBL fold metallo-hydrolase [Spirochaetia bacterium]|nr:MBL fold metallo-hydrolase [Spirochaetia bacterium]
MRSSIRIEGQRGESIVIDTGPEFRIQALREGITHIDGILVTHAHADHIHGLDDIRGIAHHNPMPVYCNAPTAEEIKERFSYAFRATQKGGGKPRIDLIEVDSPFAIGGITITPIPVKHGILDILGWQLREGKRIALYLTDTSALPQTSFERIAKPPDVLIIGALRDTYHVTHFNFDQAINTGLSLGAKSIYLTHICHDFTHTEIEAYCRREYPKESSPPSRIHAAYDRLKIALD